MATKTFKIGLSNTDKQNMAQEVYERLLALTFPEYDTSTNYSVGDFVVYNDQLYKCIGSTSGAWDSTKWQLATLNDLLTDIEDAVQFVNDKANVDGNYPTLTAGLADNLTPYSEDSGAEQTNPFISNGTGTNNNTEIVTVGDYGLLKEKQGNTVVANQKFDKTKIKSSGSGTNYSWVKNDDRTVTITVTDTIQQDTTIILTENISNAYAKVPIGHRFLYTTHNPNPNIRFRDSYSGLDYPSGTGTYVKANNTDNILVSVNLKAGLVAGTYKIDTDIVDLTQMFNGDSDIIDDLTANPSHFSWYYNGDLSYNAGSLVNANGVKLVSTKRNIYNPNETYNVVIPNKPFFASKTTTITYYDKDKNAISTENVSAGNTFTTPSNCVFINSSISAITITPYYTPEEGGEGYLDSNNVPIEYPYEEPYVVETDTEVLRSAGNVHDIKLPNGEIKRNVGYVDLGTLNWNYATDYNYFYATVPNIKNISSTSEKIGMICAKYKTVAQNVWATNKPCICKTISSNQILVGDDNYTDAATFKTAMSGVYLFYELASTTTEQGTPFAENLPINDYGMLYWLDSSNNLIGIPQGAKIFYPVNYKGFVDDLYSKVEGNSDDYALNSELNAKFETYLKSLSGYDATATQVLKNVEGTLTWVTEE